MEIILSNTINGLSRYLHENKVDLIVVHGDRVEALAGAIVGALRNTLIAHIEGGEISGTVDELIRHAISKLSHIHFVANRMAEKRLKQLGERPENIFRIGSPDIDVMLSNKLPSLDKAKERYQIEFGSYSIVLLHPVTTELEMQRQFAEIFVEALLESKKNYIVIYPNNDLGAEHILSAYNKLKGNPAFKIYPSLRFEYFLTFLKNADYLIGNSSAGMHEAPVYGIPTINIGTRQRNRFQYESILNVEFEKKAILTSIKDLQKRNRSYHPTTSQGLGDSAKKFIESLDKIWSF
jgi:UDP-N-acetylglucosamine 2-epimerase (hydrolysing)